jgi:hypothetical protein
MAILLCHYIHNVLSFYCGEVVMKSYGYEISDAIIVAGLTAMKGQFTALNVEGALCRAAANVEFGFHPNHGRDKSVLS